MPRIRDLSERLRDATAAPVGFDELARRVYAAVEPDIPFDFGCFATTDPATGVITWASKTRSLGTGDEDWSATEYGPPDLNSFAEIATRRPPAGALWLDTGGHPETCRRHREFMAPHYGFTDELRVAMVSRGAMWAVLALYRGPGDPPFTADEAARLGAAGELLAEAVQRSLFQRPERAVRTPAALDGPAVIIIGDDDRVTHLTPAAEAVIEELGGREHGSLPANVLAVVASARTAGAHADTRTQGREGRWLSLRAAVLAGPADRKDVVVTVEVTPRGELSRLALTAHGLTAREEDVALLVLQGVDTRGIAAALHLSAHTVQDHLKTIFAKLGVSSRREMTARLVLD